MFLVFLVACLVDNKLKLQGEFPSWSLTLTLYKPEYAPSARTLFKTHLRNINNSRGTQHVYNKGKVDLISFLNLKVLGRVSGTRELIYQYATLLLQINKYFVSTNRNRKGMNRIQLHVAFCRQLHCRKRNIKFVTFEHNGKSYRSVM